MFRYNLEDKRFIAYGKNSNGCCSDNNLMIEWHYQILVMRNNKGRYSGD